MPDPAPPPSGSMYLYDAMLPPLEAGRYRMVAGQDVDRGGTGLPLTGQTTYFDLESPRMAFGRVCLIGDAAIGLRPHVAAGQAKACADAWALRDCLARADGELDSALAAWEPAQLALGHRALARTREMGQSSQFDGTMIPGDPAWKFGLWEPGN